jgi:hypothetical protein
MEWSKFDELFLSSPVSVGLAVLLVSLILWSIYNPNGAKRQTEMKRNQEEPKQEQSVAKKNVKKLKQLVFLQLCDLILS